MSKGQAIYVTPDVDDDFVCGIVSGEAGFASLDDLLPRLWEGKYKTHIMAVENADPDDAHAVSHLVLLQGPLNPRQGTPFYFNGEKIENISCLVYWSSKFEKFVRLHCRDCAMKVIDFILSHQEKWCAECQQASKAPRTYH